MRAPPDGALYHRDVNTRFEELLEQARPSDVPGRSCPDARAAGAVRRARGAISRRGRSTAGRCSPRRPRHRRRRDDEPRVGASRHADLTVFLGELAAQDSELIRLGRIVDLRADGALPAVARRPTTTEPQRAGRADEIMDVVLRTVDGVAKRSA